MYEYGPPRLPSLLRHWCGCKIDKSRQELLQSKLFSRTLIVTVSPYYLTQGGSVTGARMHYPVHGPVTVGPHFLQFKDINSIGVYDVLFTTCWYYPPPPL